MLQNVAYTGAVTLACARTPRAHGQASNSARRTAGRRAAPRWALDPCGEFDERGRKILLFAINVGPGKTGLAENNRQSKEKCPSF